MGVKVDLRVPVGLPIPRTAEFIRRCEEAGFFGAGVHDHPHSGRDVYLTLALAAQRTTRIALYPATSNPVTRHPLELAALANSLEEVVTILADATAEKGGGKFIAAYVKDDPTCDAKLKDFKASVRCIPLQDEYDGPGKCIITGERVPQRVIVAKAY